MSIIFTRKWDFLVLLAEKLAFLLVLIREANTPLTADFLGPELMRVAETASWAGEVLFPSGLGFPGTGVGFGTAYTA